MNNNLLDTTKQLDGRLPSTGSESLGLSSGKTGRCIYFYLLHRLTGHAEYRSLADKWLKEVAGNVEGLKQYGIKQGIAGIGLGIDYLIDNRLVRGDSNRILSDMDAELFRQLSFPANRDKLDFSVRLQILYYFIVRLKKQNKNREQAWLFREIIVQTVNDLSENINVDIFDDPLVFDLDYTLPQYLYILGLLSDIYSPKIQETVSELSLRILSKIPFLHANRLYMLRGIAGHVRNDKRWRSHCDLLYREFDFDEMLHHEFRSRNIYFTGGLPAVYLLLNSMPEYFTRCEMNEYSRRIIEKIQQSPEWEYLANDENYFKMKTGLLDGYGGTSLLLHYHENRPD